MVGFIQHASARFVQLQQPPDGREYELYLNSLFPLVASGSGFRKSLFDGEIDTCDAFRILQMSYNKTLVKVSKGLI